MAVSAELERIAEVMKISTIDKAIVETYAQRVVGESDVEARSFIDWFLRTVPAIRDTHVDLDQWYNVEGHLVDAVCRSSVPFLEKLRLLIFGEPDDTYADAGSWKDCFISPYPEEEATFERSFKAASRETQVFTLWILLLNGHRYAFWAHDLAFHVDWGDLNQLVRSVGPHISSIYEPDGAEDFWRSVIIAADHFGVIKLRIPQEFTDMLVHTRT